MPSKVAGPGTFEPIDEFDGGFGWIAHPEETMQRAGHALVDDGSVWLVDPVDARGLDGRLATYDEVAGVAVLFHYHRRDAARIARRHDVPVSLPAGMTAFDDDDVDAPVEWFTDRLGGTDYELVRIARSPIWQEWALFDGETLLVPESVGTAAYFRASGERLGVSMMRRLSPPREALGGLEPDRILCSHGAGVFAGASEELARALRESRRTAPRMYVALAPTLVRNLASALFR